MARIGVDLGGTKLLTAALSETGDIAEFIRSSTPRGDYRATIRQIREQVLALEAKLGTVCSVGVGIPGSIAPATQLVQNANSTWLNGQPFASDIAEALARPVRIENDANCFALSEAVDGAGARARSVFGVIMGTGVGGGLINEGRILNGPRSTGGEFGHCPLPYPTLDEIETPPCWCGKTGCIETWISGPALSAHYNKAGSPKVETVEEIVELADDGNEEAKNALVVHGERTARALSLVATIFDPEVIVLGGGLSNLRHLYTETPTLIKPYLFSDERSVDIRPPKYGAESGVRGAARLWPNDPPKTT